MAIVGWVDWSECKKDENKGEGLYTVYLSYLLPPAMSLGRETWPEAVLLVPDTHVHPCIFSSSVFSGSELSQENGNECGKVGERKKLFLPSSFFWLVW